MEVSVVLLFKNRWDLTHARLFELFKYSPKELLEVILVDDASDDEDCRRGVEWWQKDMNLPYKLRYFRNSESKSFGYSMNNGAKVAEGDVIILLSNDVQIGGDFISQIIGVLSEDNRRFIGNEVYTHDTGWNTFNGKIFPYAAGYMLSCTKEAWDDVGGFDLQFHPFDFEDVDISTSAVHKGYELYPLNSLYLHHMAAQTIGYNPEREAITNKNKERFGEKWI